MSAKTNRHIVLYGAFRRKLGKLKTGCFCFMKNFSEPGVLASAVIPEFWETEAGGSQVMAKPGQFGDLERYYLKTKNYKRGWGYSSMQRL